MPAGREITNFLPATAAFVHTLNPIPPAASLSKIFSYPPLFGSGVCFGLQVLSDRRLKSAALPKHTRRISIFLGQQKPTDLLPLEILS